MPLAILAADVSCHVVEHRSAWAPPHIVRTPPKIDVVRSRSIRLRPRRALRKPDAAHPVDGFILRRMAVRRALTAARRLIAQAPFETGVFALAVVYAVLHLSPSSYSLALEQLGEHETPLLGTARGIRTDEWSVMTPLFEVAVNNDFSETNATSFYGETLRSFIGLPLLNWGLPFKPLVWPFFVLPPALAYSLYWAANAALMLIGWSLLLRRLGFSRLVAGFASAILYFSPFVQAWSGPSPQLSIFPWVMLALLSIRSPVRLALALALLVPVWWMGLFYPAGIPPLLILALALCLAFYPDAFTWRRLVPAVIGATTGAAISLLYFAPVFRAYADSVYPGDRWVNGGGLPAWQVVSQLLPATTTEGYTNLVAENICEAATVATWLPLLAICLVDFGDVRRRHAARDPEARRDVRRLGVLLGAWSVLSLWQLVPVPPLSYAFGLGLSPEARTLFASGALLLVAAAYVVDRLPLRLTLLRLAAFAAVVVTAWIVASFDLQPSNELLVRDELLVLVLVVGIAPFAVLAGRSAPRTARLAILLLALIPSVVGWGLFNPLQSTRVMFRKPHTQVTRALDELASTRSDGAIAVPGIADAVLNGVGYRSVTHVVVVPSPAIFRDYFPTMDEEKFDRIFNRYAHVQLTDRPEPYVLQSDVIRVPIQVMARYAATGDIPERN